MTNTEALARKICTILDNKKAENIVCLDISKVSILADYFIICSGRNPLLVKALYDEVEENMEKEGHTLTRSEGYRESRWVVMDYGDIMIHIFHEPEREFYHLERLWDDGTNRLQLEHLQE